MSDHEETAQIHSDCRVPKVPETQTMAKLYLEWGRFTTARNGRECRMHRAAANGIMQAEKLPKSAEKTAVLSFLNEILSEYHQGIDY